MDPASPPSPAFSPHHSPKGFILVVAFVVVTGVAAFVYEHFFNKTPPDTFMAFLTNPREAKVNGGDSLEWGAALTLDQQIKGQKATSNGRVAEEVELQALAAQGGVTLCSEGWVSAGKAEGAATVAEWGKICGGKAVFSPSLGGPATATGPATEPMAGIWAVVQAPSSEAVKEVAYNLGLGTKGVWSFTKSS